MTQAAALVNRWRIYYLSVRNWDLQTDFFHYSGCKGGSDSSPPPSPAQDWIRSPLPLSHRHFLYTEKFPSTKAGPGPGLGSVSVLFVARFTQDALDPGRLWFLTPVCLISWGWKSCINTAHTAEEEISLSVHFIQGLFKGAQALPLPSETPYISHTDLARLCEPKQLSWKKTQ